MNRFCGACGMLLPDAARYCPRCGAVATQPPPGPALRPRRSRVGMALGGFGMALLIIVAVFVVRGVRGTSAGAASPDDLVTRMAEAMTGLDPAAAIALLDPEELPGLRDLYATAVDQVREGVDIDVPGALDALEVSVTDVDHDVTYLDAEKEFAKVTFRSGRITYDADPDRLPDGVRESLESDGEPLEAEHGAGDLSELAFDSENGTRIDPFLVLVSHDGRWFVSLSLTVGEYVVSAFDLPAGRYDDPDGIGPPAESPEAAIAMLLDGAVGAANGEDPDGTSLSGLVPEAQTRAVRVYGRSLQALVDDEFDGSESETWFGGDCEECRVDHDGLEVSTRRNGALTHAVLDALRLTVSAPLCRSSYGDEFFSYDDEYGYDDYYDDDYDEYGQYDEFGEEYDLFDSGFAAAGRDASRIVDDDCTVETLVVQWDGTCAEVGISHEPAVAWADDESDSACLGDELGDSGLTLADFGITDLHVVVTQERGGWVVDPVATIMDYGTTALSHLSDEKVKQALSD